MQRCWNIQAPDAKKINVFWPLIHPSCNSVVIMILAMDQLLLLISARRLARDGVGRSTREKADLSLREFAQMVGVDVSTLSRWERGQSRPHLPGAARWAKACQEIENREDRDLP